MIERLRSASGMDGLEHAHMLNNLEGPPQPMLPPMLPAHAAMLTETDGMIGGGQQALGDAQYLKNISGSCAHPAAHGVIPSHLPPSPLPPPQQQVQQRHPHHINAFGTVAHHGTSPATAPVPSWFNPATEMQWGAWAALARGGAGGASVAVAEAGAAGEAQAAAMGANCTFKNQVKPTEGPGSVMLQSALSPPLPGFQSDGATAEADHPALLQHPRQRQREREYQQAMHATSPFLQRQEELEKQGREMLQHAQQLQQQGLFAMMGTSLAGVNNQAQLAGLGAESQGRIDGAQPILLPPLPTQAPSAIPQEPHPERTLQQIGRKASNCADNVDLLLALRGSWAVGGNEDQLLSIAAEARAAVGSPQRKHLGRHPLGSTAVGLSTSPPVTGKKVGRASSTPGMKSVASARGAAPGAPASDFGADTHAGKGALSDSEGNNSCVVSETGAAVVKKSTSKKSKHPSSGGGRRNSRGQQGVEKKVPWSRATEVARLQVVDAGRGWGDIGCP